MTGLLLGPTAPEEISYLFWLGGNRQQNSSWDNGTGLCSLVMPCLRELVGKFHPFFQ